MSIRSRHSLSEENVGKRGDFEEKTEHRILKIENDMVLLKGQLNTVIALLTKSKKPLKSNCRSDEEEDDTSEESDSQTVSTHKNDNMKLTKDQRDEDYRWIHKPVDAEFIDCLDSSKGPVVFGGVISKSPKDYAFLISIMYFYFSMILKLTILFLS